MTMARWKLLTTLAGLLGISRKAKTDYYPDWWPHTKDGKPIVPEMKLWANDPNPEHYWTVEDVGVGLWIQQRYPPRMGSYPHDPDIDGPRTRYQGAVWATQAQRHKSLDHIHWWNCYSYFPGATA